MERPPRLLCIHILLFKRPIHQLPARQRHTAAIVHLDSLTHTLCSKPPTHKKSVIVHVHTLNVTLITSVGPLGRTFVSPRGRTFTNFQLPESFADLLDRSTSRTSFHTRSSRFTYSHLPSNALINPTARVTGGFL